MSKTSPGERVVTWPPSVTERGRLPLATAPRSTSTFTVRVGRHAGTSTLNSPEPTEVTSPRIPEKSTTFCTASDKKFRPWTVMVSPARASETESPVSCGLSTAWTVNVVVAVSCSTAVTRITTSPGVDPKRTVANVDPVESVTEAAPVTNEASPESSSHSTVTSFRGAPVDVVRTTAWRRVGRS